MIGFLNFDDTTPPTHPTTQELLVGLSGAQRIAILVGFSKRIRPNVLAHKDLIHKDVVGYFYNKLKLIRDYSTKLMRQEIVVTPEVVDSETGEVTQEAVYNDKPITAIQLRDALVSEFTDFTEDQITAIGTEMIKYSKSDGTGDWSFYSTEIVK